MRYYLYSTEIPLKEAAFAKCALKRKTDKSHKFYRILKCRLEKFAFRKFFRIFFSLGSYTCL